ncbi:MAG: S8 family serine peptidase [Melioribacteraceae bacterium]
MRTVIGVLITLVFVTMTQKAQKMDIKIKKVAGRQIKSIMWNNKNINIIKGEIAVKVIPSISNEQITELLNYSKCKLIKSFNKLGWGLLKLEKEEDELILISRIKKLPYILAAEPNMIIHLHFEPNDPYFRGITPATYKHQWSLINIGQSPPGGTIGADINATNAWDITIGNSDVILAILDSGIPMQNGRLSHPDLDDASKIILGIDCINDGEGVRDIYGHGTHVAGIASAETNNNLGVAGVSWNSNILVIQVFDSDGYGTWDAFQDAVEYAVDYKRNNPGKNVIINFSGGAFYTEQQVEDAIAYANNYGVTIVASAGNDCGFNVNYPAAYSSSYNNVIAVSATDHNNLVTEYSNIGPEINISAPGGYGTTNVCVYPFYIYYDYDDVFSTTPNYYFNIQASNPEVTQNYGYLAGTSMAAPHVAGTAALILSINPNLLPYQIRNILQNSADWKPHMGNQPPSDEYGYGRLNAYKALKYTIENYGALLGIEMSQVRIPLWEDLILREDINLASNTILTIEANNLVTVSSYSGIVTLGGTGGLSKIIDEEEIENLNESLPLNNYKEFRISQNYPNPFNPTTVISYQLPEKNYVTLKVYDILGREIATLVNEYKDAGSYKVEFSADEYQLASGIYFYTLKAGKNFIVKKMMFIK